MCSGSLRKRASGHHLDLVLCALCSPDDKNLEKMETSYSKVHTRALNIFLVQLELGEDYIQDIYIYIYIYILQM